MTFVEAIAFEEAIALLRKRNLLPTSLSSAELSRIGKEIAQVSVMSARVEDARALTILKDFCDQSIATLSTKTFTTADMPSFVQKMRAWAQESGYVPAPEDANTIKDLTSISRLRLMAETNHGIISGFGKAVFDNQPAVRDAFPAQELYRVGYRNKERDDWHERWADAGGKEFDGRMIATVDDEVWQALGDGEGGYTDTLGNSWAPFAFNSGMGTRLISRKEATDLGVIDDGETVEPRKLDLLENFTAGLERIAPELRAGIKL